MTIMLFSQDMAASRPRSSDWEDEEVEVLLEVANEMEVFKLLDGKKRKHKSVSTYVLPGVVITMRMSMTVGHAQQQGCEVGVGIAWSRGNEPEV